MVSFNALAAALAAFAAVSEATYHGHMAKRHLHMRASYGNVTDVYPVPIGTGSPAPVPVTTTPAVVDSPETDYTTTTAQTIATCLTVTYTLGNGKEVVTTITKYETTTKSVAHVKATLTVAPIIESTPSVSPMSASSTVAPVASSVPSSKESSHTPVSAPSTVAPVASSVPSSKESSHTSTTTLYVTAPPSGTHTVAAGPSAPTCPSIETVYLPTYITIYNTVSCDDTIPKHYLPNDKNQHHYPQLFQDGDADRVPRPNRALERWIPRHAHSLFVEI
ncbi:unnamed protein product [Tuber aestivum]|uniref:Yeast cell wall synthesis Kre9/Knh1 C-terminal domain-containing protein n=1 Tax=Tuber aestivum TaxID=59557 RepID=A0A292Q8T9_9PEZI|nr:unnamed protein product [Tuber aestivum]